MYSPYRKILGYLGKKKFYITYPSTAQHRIFKISKLCISVRFALTYHSSSPWNQKMKQTISWRGSLKNYSSIRIYRIREKFGNNDNVYSKEELCMARYSFSLFTSSHFTDPELKLQLCFIVKNLPLISNWLLNWNSNADSWIWTLMFKTRAYKVARRASNLAIGDSRDRGVILVRESTTLESRRDFCFLFISFRVRPAEDRHPILWPLPRDDCVTQKGSLESNSGLAPTLLWPIVSQVPSVEA